MLSNPKYFRILEYYISIRWDFKTWRNIDIELKQSKDINVLFKAFKSCYDSEKKKIELNNISIEDRQYISHVLLEKLKLFLVGGVELKENREQSSEILYDWIIDEQVIYSAFYSRYKIDLSKEKLHWFNFLALFNDLRDCLFTDYYMHYRALTEEEISKHSSEIQAKMRRTKAEVRIGYVEVEEDDAISRRFGVK